MLPKIWPWGRSAPKWYPRCFPLNKDLTWPLRVVRTQYLKEVRVEVFQGGISDWKKPWRRYSESKGIFLLFVSLSGNNLFSCTSSSYFWGRPCLGFSTPKEATSIFKHFDLARDQKTMTGILEYRSSAGTLFNAWLLREAWNRY